jgi:hypothetical protein
MSYIYTTKVKKCDLKWKPTFLYDCVLSTDKYRQHIHNINDNIIFSRI